MSVLHGSKGQAYPVRRGEVWECYGHLVACGDLEQGAGEQLLEWGRRQWWREGDPDTWQRKPALFYADPPWSPSLLTRFRNAAGADIQSAYTVETVVRRIARLARGVPLLLEMGTSYDRDQVLDWLSEHDGGRLLVPITYAGGKPAWLYISGVPLAQAQPLVRAVTQQDDERIPAIALAALTAPGDVVVDPCLGLGCTLRAAERTGRVCWGLELVPQRCSSALASLTKLRRCEPIPIGELK